MQLVRTLGKKAASAAVASVPDPFVVAVVLAVGVCVAGIIAGLVGGSSFSSSVAGVFNAWAGPEGMWKYLPFAMQMTLILVLGHAFVSAPPIRRVQDVLAAVPTTTGAAAYMVSLIACAAALVHWGLGLIVGATLARRVAIVGLAQGRRFHYPLLGAAGYSGLMVWHGGLTGTGPSEAAAGTFLVTLPLGETIFSDLNLVVAMAGLALIPLFFRWLAPLEVERRDTIEGRLSPEELFPPVEERPKPAGRGVRKLERSPAIRVAFCLLLIGALVTHTRMALLADERVSWLNLINGFFFATALLLHPTMRSFVKGVNDAARGAAGIILQFPIYAGIAAVMVQADFVEGLCRLFGDPDRFSAPQVFVSASLVNLFIPSGGQQFAVHGQVLREAILHGGSSTLVMALAYGDQLTNMIQPFWSLALLGITGLRARDIMGFCVVAMVLFWPVVLIALLLLG